MDKPVEPVESGEDVGGDAQQSPAGRRRGCGCFTVGFVAITALSVLDIVRSWRGELRPATDPVLEIQLAIVLLSGASCLLVALWAALLLFNSLSLGRSRAPALAAARTAALLGLLATVGVGGFAGAGYAQAVAFDRAERAAGLIRTAIDAFREEHGVPPKSLDDLVPEHLDSVPSTTLESAPQFEYEPDRWDGRLYVQWGSDRYAH
ncbi:MAG: hypothetical protein AAGI22_01775 [Planctomycetota bacterium]